MGAALGRRHGFRADDLQLEGWPRVVRAEGLPGPPGPHGVDWRFGRYDRATGTNSEED